MDNKQQAAGALLVVCPVVHSIYMCVSVCLLCSICWCGIHIPMMAMMAQVELADYLGSCSYMGATLAKAGIVSPDPSMAQVWGLVNLSL